jgi:hypothetical protein
MWVFSKKKGGEIQDGCGAHVTAILFISFLNKKRYLPLYWGK